MPKVALVRPDLFTFSWSPFAPRLGKALLVAGQNASEPMFEPNMAVLVRTKNDEGGLQKMLAFITAARQEYAGRIDVIVVDTESLDGTLQLAKDFGATIVPITQAEFNYPKSINMGLSAVKPDVVVAFITVGHALPALSNCLQASVRHFIDTNVVGVYGRAIPNDNASIWERIFFSRSSKITIGDYKIAQAHVGVMGATNCMVRMSSWQPHHFDEAYAGGGEDTAWAAEARKRGEDIVFEPALSVHHTHSLGLVNVLRQRKHWLQVAHTATGFDTAEVAKRRPDLFR